MHSNYFVELPSVGVFEIRRYAFKAHLDAIKQYHELLGGTDESLLPKPIKDQFWLVAYLKSVIVKAPDGWDLDALDVLGGEEEQLFELNRRVQEKEDSFRSGRQKKPEDSGERAVENTGLVVPGSL